MDGSRRSDPVTCGLGKMMKKNGVDTAPPLFCAFVSNFQRSDLFILGRNPSSHSL